MLRWKTGCSFVVWNPVSNLYIVRPICTDPWHAYPLRLSETEILKIELFLAASGFCFQLSNVCNVYFTVFQQFALNIGFCQCLSEAAFRRICTTAATEEADTFDDATGSQFLRPHNSAPHGSIGGTRRSDKRIEGKMCANCTKCCIIITRA